MRRPRAAHVVSALPNSGSALKSAESEPFGERHAESEVLGLSIALHVVDEIGGHGVVVVEPEGDPDLVRGGFGRREFRHGGGERLLHGRRRQECRVDVGMRRQGLVQAIGEGLGQLVGSQDQSGETVRRLSRQRGKANRLEQANSLPQPLRIVDEALPFVHPLVPGPYEIGRFVRDVGEADKAEYAGHS